MQLVKFTTRSHFDVNKKFNCRKLWDGQNKLTKYSKDKIMKKLVF